MVEQVESAYYFVNPEEVKDFLHKNNCLSELLLKVSTFAREIFGQVFLELEFYQDHEEDYEGLLVIVHANIFSSESLSLLDKFEDKLDTKVGILSFLIRTK